MNSKGDLRRSLDTVDWAGELPWGCRQTVGELEAVTQSAVCCDWHAVPLLLLFW